MTETVELSIPYDDLTRISIICPCGSEITTDITSGKNREHQWEHRTIRCPMCSKQFDDELKFALDKLTSWYDRIKKTELKVFFKVRKMSVSEK